MAEYGQQYDPAYELANILFGSDVASRYRGGGLAQPELRELVNQYQMGVEQDAFERTALLGEREQDLVNALRQRQRASDVGLLGEFGAPLTEAMRELDPRLEAQVESQRQLAERLYSEAQGDFSPEREAEILERAFETSAMQGRERDPRLAYDRLLGAEDARTMREQKAQQAGTNLYNQLRGQTGGVAQLLLGMQGSPYERGVGTISPIFGATAAINQSLQNYQNQQNFAANQEAQRQMQELTRIAQERGDPTILEQAQGWLNAYNQGTAILSDAANIIQGLPEDYNNFKSGFGQTIDALGGTFGDVAGFFGFGGNDSINGSLLDFGNFDTGGYSLLPGDSGYDLDLGILGSIGGSTYNPSNPLGLDFDFSSSGGGLFD